VVCQSIGLEKNKWDLFRDTVREEIRIRRTNANTAIRREYMGKSEKNMNATEIISYSCLYGISFTYQGFFCVYSLKWVSSGHEGGAREWISSCACS